MHDSKVAKNQLAGGFTEDTPLLQWVVTIQTNLLSFINFWASSAFKFLNLKKKRSLESEVIWVSCHLLIRNALALGKWIYTKLSVYMIFVAFTRVTANHFHSNSLRRCYSLFLCKLPWGCWKLCSFVLLCSLLTELNIS